MMSAPAQPTIFDGLSLAQAAFDHCPDVRAKGRQRTRCTNGNAFQPAAGTIG
jgi:hypothetical protein